MTKIRSLLYPTIFKRFLFFAILDGFTVILSLYACFLIYFELGRGLDYSRIVAEIAPYFILCRLAIFGAMKVYRITWRYFGIVDLFNIIVALALSELILMTVSYVPLPSALAGSFVTDLPVRGLPKSIFFMDFTISLLLLSFLRTSKRLYVEVVREKRTSKRGRRAVILGAGNTGEMILRDMARQSYSEYYPIGFLDDDERKKATYIHGVPVMGRVDKFEEVVMNRGIKAVIIAMPSLDHKRLRSLYDSAKRLKVETVKTVPRIYGVNKPDVNLKSLEDLSIEDLIGRVSVKIDYEGISLFLHDKSVLVTGAGGSIGSEIAAQISSFGPKRLVLLDIDETELHNLGLRFARVFPELTSKTHFVTGDIRDEKRMEEVFSEYPPQVIFHAAAYKHVPMMEHNPKEAVKTNIFGTYTIVKLAAQYGAEKFIMISTDKAVQPTSVMGATKRIAEYICSAFNDAGGIQPLHHSTQFISVRFGNVLGSRGSVLPLFLEQLKHGGPLTVTHREMRRYFMTIPEAISLVLQASVIGEGGEVLVLDMGEPVRIIDIAEELIKMHGLQPYKDVDIRFTGLRPGEKLFEEILTAEEGTDASVHEKVFIARNGRKYGGDEIEIMVNEFRALLNRTAIKDEYRIKDLLKRYVAHYEEVDSGAN